MQLPVATESTYWENSDGNPPPNKKIAMEIDIMRPQINLIKYNIIKLNKV